MSGSPLCSVPAFARPPLRCFWLGARSLALRFGVRPLPLCPAVAVPPFCVLCSVWPFACSVVCAPPGHRSAVRTDMSLPCRRCGVPCYPCLLRCLKPQEPKQTHRQRGLRFPCCWVRDSTTTEAGESQRTERREAQGPGGGDRALGSSSDL